MNMLEHMKMVNDERNSLLYWYPRLSVHIPTPRTKMLMIPRDIIIDSVVEGRIKDTSTVETLLSSADSFSYPVFVRTDVCSSKHDWDTTCFVPTRNDVIKRCQRLLVDNLNKNLAVRGIIFRDFLKLEAPFRAFMGMPVAKERRYFVKDGQVLCHHPYWPEDAIWFKGDSAKELANQGEDYRLKLKAINEETEDEVDELSELACLAVNKLDHNYWSVDFAKDIDGKWWLIDMAMGEVSYHWIDCPNCPEDMRRQYRDRIEHALNLKEGFLELEEMEDGG